MKMYLSALAPAAVLGLTALFPGVALAQGSGPISSVPASSQPPSYYAQLVSLTNSSGMGSAGITFEGDRAAIAVSTLGLSATPHIQTIDLGTCPAPSRVLTTLSTSGSTAPAVATDPATAPRGSSYTYHRFIQLSANTINDIKDGHAVVVVDGPHIATSSHQAQLSQEAAPALCGTLKTT
ncbi:MAG: hypothetical protein JO272_03370 [Pseudonocardiales bacterium]|nr:hypothetical protein [Pseudonocardiales bacterium]